MMTLGTFLMYAFYGALAVLFVWVSVVYRDRPAVGASGAAPSVDTDDTDTRRRGYTSVIRSRQRLSVRMSD